MLNTKVFLWSGNKYNKKDIFIKHLENFKNNLIEDEILLLEKRLKNLYKFEENDSESNNDDESDNNNGIIIKNKILL